MHLVLSGTDNVYRSFAIIALDNLIFRIKRYASSKVIKSLNFSLRTKLNLLLSARQSWQNAVKPINILYSLSDIRFIEVQKYGLITPAGQITPCVRTIKPTKFRRKFRSVYSTLKKNLLMQA